MGNTDVKIAVSVIPSFGLLTVYPYTITELLSAAP